MVLFRVFENRAPLSVQSSARTSPTQRYAASVETGETLIGRTIRFYRLPARYGQTFTISVGNEIVPAGEEKIQRRICRQSAVCRNKPLHDGAARQYANYEQLLPELQKYMPEYEKTRRYFTRTNLYKYLTENGDLERAMSNSKKLCQLHRKFPDDSIAYSEIYRVVDLLNNLNK